MRTGTAYMGHLILIGLGIVALCATAPAAPLSPEEVSALAVPRIATPPVIDGVIDAAEWRGASAISGAADQGKEVLITRPTTFFFAWDPGHLYFACRTYLRPGHKPRISNGRSEGLAFVFDEGLELVFKPEGKNVTFDDAGAAYKLFINALGFVGDLTRLELGQQLKNWGPKFKTATRVTEPGTAPEGGSWWELEVGTTPADFNLKSDHRIGDTWKVMLGINHFPMWMQARIPCTGTYFEQEGYTRLRLTENEPVVQFTMDALSNLASDGTAAMAVNTYNPASKPTAVRVTLNVADKIVKEQDLTLPAGGSASFTLNEKLPEDVKTGKVRLTVTQADAQLLNYTVLFNSGAYAWMIGKMQPADPGKFAFKTTFNPVRMTLLISGDTYYLPDPSAAQSLRYTLKSESGAEAAKGTISKIAEWYFRELVSLPALAAGKYTVEATMMLKDGTALGPMQATIEKLDETKAFPEWWGKSIGNVERVLPPFTAIKSVECRAANGGNDTLRGFACWGREYALSALGLPTALTSQGKSLLAAPARIVVTRNGVDTTVSMGQATVTRAQDWRVLFEGKAEGAGLMFSAKGRLEQDGLVYVELTYAPLDGKPATLDALRIEFPLTDEEAEGVLCIGPGSNFSSKTHKSISGKKTGLLWSTLETGRTGSGMTVGSFYPTVWIGNERRGFLWWADNDKGWFPDDEIPAHEATREKATRVRSQESGSREKGMVTAVVFRNNLIGKPVEVAGTHAVRFSYNATPFKPLLPGWRSWAATEDGTFFQPHRNVRMDSKTGKKVNEGGRQRNWIHPESRYPEEWSALWAAQKSGAREAGFTGADAHMRPKLPFDPYAARNGIEWGHMSFALHGYGEKSLEQNLYRYFGDEWVADGQETWNTTYIDYAMYLFERAMREGGVHSTYFDLTFPIPMSTLIGELGYLLPDGRLQRGYNGWNQRQFFMRLHALSHDAGLLPGCNGSHSTHAYVLVAIPWLDAVLDGERNWNLDLTDRDWIDYYSIDQMRFMANPHNWGLGICWMANLDTQDANKRVLGKTKQGEYVWMFDSWINVYVSPGPTRMPKSVLDWGLNGGGAEYVPFWRNEAVKTKTENVLVSLWRLPGESRVMLGVYNHDRAKTQDITAKIDPDAVGLKGDSLVARDLYAPTGAAVVFNAKKRTLEVAGLPPHRIRLIGVAQTDPAERDRLLKTLPAWASDNTVADILQDFGFLRAETKVHEVGKAPGVSCENTAIQVGMWQLPDRILLTLANTDAKATQTIVVTLDLAALGLKIKPWQEFVGVRTWNKGEKDSDATLSYDDGKLTVKGVKPGSGRLVAIRKY